MQPFLQLRCALLSRKHQCTLCAEAPWFQLPFLRVAAEMCFAGITSLVVCTSWAWETTCSVTDDRVLLSVQVSHKPRPARGQRCITAAITVRPYTVRKGDTLLSIAEKRGAQHTCFAPRLTLRVSRPGFAAAAARLWASGTQGEHVIAAEIEVGQLTKLNHDRNPEDVKEGQTILLPAGKLSFRDKEILAGIGSGNYRTYPVRKSETIEDIISKRNITRAEVDALNQGANLNKLSGAHTLAGK